MVTVVVVMVVLVTVVVMVVVVTAVVTVVVETVMVVVTVVVVTVVVTVVVETVVVVTVAMAITIINAKQMEGLRSTALCPEEALSLRGWGQEDPAGEGQSQVAPIQGARAQSPPPAPRAAVGLSWTLCLQRALGWKTMPPSPRRERHSGTRGCIPGVKGWFPLMAERAQLLVRSVWLRRRNACFFHGEGWRAKALSFHENALECLMGVKCIKSPSLHNS